MIPRMTRLRLSAPIVCGFALIGCAQSTAVIDAGQRDSSPFDATSSEAESTDAGLAGDTGVQRDASTPADVGTPPDAGAPDPTVVERTYRVLHWNIAGGAEHDCEPAAIARVVRRYVQDHDVDFVGLNEVCPEQFPAIEEALRSLWGLGPRASFAAYVGDGVPGVVGNAIYSRFGIQNVTRHMVGEDMFGARNLLCGEVPDLPHARFCSVHLTPADATARTQLGRVIERVERWWTDGRDTVILTGDLNIAPNDVGLNAVYTAAVDTPNNRDNRGDYHELDDADPVHCNGYGERSQPGTAAGPCGEGQKIDFILVRANRIADDRYSGDTLDIPTDCTGVCSDHRAVSGSVRVRVAID